MKGALILLAACAVVCGSPVQAWACGTCNVDGGDGQWLMLLFMLSLPLVATAVGIGVIRRLLRRMEST